MPPCDIVALPPIRFHAAFFTEFVAPGGRSARHQLPSSLGNGTGVVSGEGAAGATGVLEGVADADADADADDDGDADAEALGLEVAEADGEAVGEGEAEADADAEAEGVGSAAGATAPAGAARPEARMPAPITALTTPVRTEPVERLTSHMRSIITRPTGAGSNRGNLGESVYSSESSLLTRGMRAQDEAQGAEHRPHGGFGHGQRNIRQFQQCAVLCGHRGNRTGE